MSQEPEDQIKACPWCKAKFCAKNSYLYDDGRPGRDQHADGKGYIVCKLCDTKTCVPIVTTDITEEIQQALAEAGIKMAPGKLPRQVT